MLEAPIGAPLRALQIYRQASLTTHAFAVRKPWQARRQANQGRRATDAEVPLHLILASHVLADASS